MKIKEFGKRFFPTRLLVLGLMVASMSTVFVACEKEDPDNNPNPDEVYFKMLCNENR